MKTEEAARIMLGIEENDSVTDAIERLIAENDALRSMLWPPLPEIKTCVDITAEKLTRYVEGQAPWDPRGELLFFKNRETPDHVRWLSRYRIGIHCLSVDGVGVTKGDKYRLSLRNRHEGRKEHRRRNATKATQANPQT